MKADRRHQLQENELAKWVAPKVQAVKPYGMLILGVIVAAVAIVVIIVLIQNSNAAEREGQWAQVMRLTSQDYFVQQAQKKQDELEAGTQMTPAHYETIFDDIENDLRDAIAQDEDTLAALRARFFIADHARDRGISALFGDRASADGYLEDAIELYEEIAELAEVQSFQQRADFYRADTLIAQSGIVDAATAKSNLEEARQIYEDLSTEGVFALAALDQLAILDRPTNTDEPYFAWFNERLQNMSSPANSNATSGTTPSSTGTGDNAPGNVGLGGITDGFGQSTGGSGPVANPPSGGN